MKRASVNSALELVERFVILALCLLAYTLLAQDDEATIKRLIEELGSDSLEAREKATDELIAIGEKAKKFVEATLKQTTDPEVRNRADLILKVIPVSSIVGRDLYLKMPDKIKTLVFGEDLFEKLKILKEVKRKGKISDNKLAPVGEMILNSITMIEGKDRYNMVKFIIESGLKSVLQVLVKLLDDKEIYFHGDYNKSLFKLDEKERADLIKLLQSKDAGERIGSARTLGLLMVTECAGDMAKLLEDNDSDVRWIAVCVLRDLKAQEFVKEIAKLLEDENETVRSCAVDALGSLDAKEYVYDMVKLLEDSDNLVRWNSVRALSDLKVKGCAKEVVKLLKNSNANIRRSAVEVLGNLEVKEYVGEIAKLLKDEDGFVRSLTASALGDLEAKEYANVIVKLLEDEEQPARMGAAYALGKLRVKETLEPLKKALEKEKDTSVRQTIKHSIKEIEGQK